MILDLEKFIEEQTGVWHELEAVLERLERDASVKMDLEEVKRFHILYQRTSADLARIESFASEPELKSYLEALVARGFAEIHETRKRACRIAPIEWLFRSLPRTFRRRIGAFRLAAAATLLGVAFGAALLCISPDLKDFLLPFENLHASPSERVAKEERSVNKALEGKKLVFSTSLMTHNTRVALFCMALGATWGIGTLILLFTNGVILGAVAADYLAAGKGVFLFGWLLPHGSVEISAILISGQAGLVLAGALIGSRRGLALSDRLRSVRADLVTLIAGAALMLVWAGVVEGFFSQYHEPVLPYWLKIGFGAAELLAVVLFFSLGGLRDRKGLEAGANG